MAFVDLVEHIYKRHNNTKSFQKNTSTQMKNVFFLLAFVACTTDIQQTIPSPVHFRSIIAVTGFRPISNAQAQAGPLRPVQPLMNSTRPAEEDTVIVYAPVAEKQLFIILEAQTSRTQLLFFKGKFYEHFQQNEPFQAYTRALSDTQEKYGRPLDFGYTFMTISYEEP
jgi:hypothetical protein